MAVSSIADKRAEYETRERGRFAIVAAQIEDDRELSPLALRVYIKLARHADTEGRCRPKQGGIAEQLGASREAVARAVRELVGRGYVEATRGRYGLAYVLPHRAGVMRRSHLDSRCDETVTSDVMKRSHLDVMKRSHLLRTDHSEQSNEHIPSPAEPARARASTISNDPVQSAGRGKARETIARLHDLAGAEGIPLTVTPRDAALVKESGAAADDIWAAYRALYRGEWGDDWMQRNLSVHLVVSRLAGYRATANGLVQAGETYEGSQALLRRDEAKIQRFRVHGGFDDTDR